MLRAGIIPTPIVTQYELQERKNRIVLATDGVFGVLSNRFVRETVDSALSNNEMKDLQHAANILAIKTAKRRWLGGLPIECKVDDVTSIHSRLYRQGHAVFCFPTKCTSSRFALYLQVPVEQQDQRQFGEKKIRMIVLPNHRLQRSYMSCTQIHYPAC